MDSINIRIQELINKLTKGNKSQFAKAIGIKAQSIQQYINEKQSLPSAEVLTAILNAYPEVNIRWLLTGKGEPLESSSPDCEKKYEGLLEKYSGMAQKLEELERENTILKTTIIQMTVERHTGKKEENLGKRRVVNNRQNGRLYR